MNKLLFLGFSLIFIFIGFLAVQSTLTSSSPFFIVTSTPTPRPRYLVTVGDVVVVADVAKTPREITQGLSGADPLGEDEGMLFVFAEKKQPAFWMKDMRFDLDMIWIADSAVVDIHENVPALPPGTPDSELPLYIPKEPVDHILEVNAGFVEDNGIVIGDKVSISTVFH